MRRVFALARTTVGQKAVMAVTGIILFGFVLMHMLGNLKVFQGPAKLDAYAEWLREVGSPLLGHGQLLWIVRGVLLVATGLHLWSAFVLTRVSRAARPVRYRRLESVESTYASRTMRWGGVLIALFVAYHLLHLTFGSVHPDFRTGSVYHNMISGFRVWPVSAFYIVAMVALSLHLFHGLWSLFQTLGWNHPKYNRYRRAFATVFALVIGVGNISMPVAILLGLVR